MEIIDFHTHVYPDQVAAKAAENIRSFYALSSSPMDGTVATLLERGRKAGVSRYVILPVAVHPEKTRHINNFILQTLQQQKAFLGFGTVHAAMENLMEEVAYIRQTGMRGIKLHPDFQTFPIDDPRLFPVYEEIQGNLPLMLHMGDLRYDYSRPARLKRIIELFPRLQVLAAHFGGYQMYEEAYQLLKDTNCCFDVSSSLMMMEPGQAERYIDLYGADRFVYGSDYPLWDPVTEMNRFMQLKLTDDQREHIFYKTAKRLLKL